ncbi:MAG TPA: hypothetical protein VG674_14050 [Amycolatopsis sp.]|nr:hypothetical protein [Amycolatopsis sp.]
MSRDWESISAGFRYAVPHTSFTFLMNPASDYLTHYPETLTAEELAERLARDIQQRTPGPNTTPDGQY